MTVAGLQSLIRAGSMRVGFDLCAFEPIHQAPHADFFDAWLDAGRAGEMAYLERNREKRRFPALLARPADLPFRTLIVLGVNYHQFDLPPEVRNDPSRGIVASYAWGDDYHEVIRPLLYEVDALIRQQTGRTTLAKCLVDTGPVLERDWAAAAGLGFTGKNSCTIEPASGSWYFLAVILVPEVIEGNDRNTARTETIERKMTCGRCTRCLASCPTGAFQDAYDLDPRRCISYWTIESRSIIPRALRPHFSNRIFGCDICQEVCPYNRRLPERTPLLAALHAQHARIAPPLLEGFDPAHPYWLDQSAFSERFVRSPIKRAKRQGMLRNVCVALGNWANPASVDALQLALADAEPVVRVHAAWAMGRVLSRQASSTASNLLASALAREDDERVREEIRLALHGAG